MRCMYCGSANIAFVEKNEGYSYKKGLAGVAMFGNIGAVAGINGKTKKIYHCSACGMDQSQPMLPIVENGISDALAAGNDSMLDHYKRMYRNIEWVGTGKKSLNAEKTFVSRGDGSSQVNSNEREDISAISNKIREYCNELNVPVSYDDLYSKFSSNSQKDINTAITDLKCKGKVKEVAPQVLVLVRDLEEMQQLIEKEKAIIENKRDEVARRFYQYIQEAENVKGLVVADSQFGCLWIDVNGIVHHNTLTDYRSLASDRLRFDKTKKDETTISHEVEKHGVDVVDIKTGPGFMVMLKKDGTVDKFLPLNDGTLVEEKCGGNMSDGTLWEVLTAL